MLALMQVLLPASFLAVRPAHCGQSSGFGFLGLSSWPFCGGFDSTLCHCFLGPALLDLPGLGCLVLTLWVVTPILGLILALRLFFGLDFLASTLWPCLLALVLCVLVPPVVFEAGMGVLLG